MIQPLIAIESFGATNVGKVRTNNEDCFICQYIWDNHFLLCAAIDGMGGYEGGEVAADIARFTLINDLEEFQGNDVFEALKQAFVNANNEIVRYKQATPKYSSMGCVATVGLFDIVGRQLYVVHVGDSRLYRFQDGVLQKLSHDHSIVGYREEIGDLTEEEAMNHPQRSVISRSVGDESHTIDDEGFLETSIFPLLSDAEYLFCSDGLSDMLRSAEIREVLANDNLATEEKVNSLIQDAIEAGGKDNVTVVLTKVMQRHDHQQQPAPVSQPAPAESSRDKKTRSYKVPFIISLCVALLAIAVIIVLCVKMFRSESPVTPEPSEQVEQVEQVEQAEVTEAAAKTESPESAESDSETEESTDSDTTDQ